MPAARSCLAWLLTGSLLLVAAVVYPQTVPHATHHSHHNAATHASVLCAWLCAAGQGVESVALILESNPNPVGLLLPTASEDQLFRYSPASASRGPPLRVA